MGNYYPLLINLNKIKCLVIGGGEVALRKTLSLKEAGADITVLSPQVISPFYSLVEKGEVKFIRRKYQRGDLKGFSLVYAALDDVEADAEIAREAEEEGVFLNMTHNPERGNFIVPAQIRRGDLILSFSTNGKSPMLAKKIRRELEEKYGPEYEEFLLILGRERVWALKEVEEINKRKAYFEALVYSELPGLIKDGKRELVNQTINRIREKLSLKRGKADDKY